MNEMRKLMETIDALDEMQFDGDKDDYEDWGFPSIDAIANEFRYDLEELLNKYWANAEHMSNDPGEVKEIQNRLEAILVSFVGKVE